MTRYGETSLIPNSRFLIYANFDRTRKTWVVKHCSSTQMAQYAVHDLRLLNDLPASLKRARISGRVLRHETSADNPQGTSEGLAGVELIFAGNGKEYKVVTEEIGTFPEGSFSYPVISNGRLYIRDLGSLWAYDIKAAR
jgi:hypothetical protein